MNIMFKRNEPNCLNLVINDSVSSIKLILDIDLYFHFHLSGFEENEKWLNYHLNNDLESMSQSEKSPRNIYNKVCELMSENPESDFIKIIYLESENNM